MRALILVATAALALSGCGNHDQAATHNVDAGMTAENIVSNDVTAIDAVTGDAANMAADVDYSNLADNSLDNMLNEGNATKPVAKAPRAKPQATQPVANTATSTTNAE